MIRLADDIWIGNSTDEKETDLETSDISGILNVAQDLQCSRGWPFGIEYMQVGLIDGPGNVQAVYVSAISALITLLTRNKVMVCCHDGSRSLAVVIMYLILKRGNRPHPVNQTILSCWTPWDKMLSELTSKVDKLPKIHDCHKEACDKLPFSLLETLT